MSRYIEEEAIIKAIDESGQRYGITTANQCNFKEIVRKTPTADVVQKSEVAREIFEEIEKKVRASITVHLEEINKEYIQDTPLYDRHSGIIFAMQGMDDFIAELKKKYTEGV